MLKLIQISVLLILRNWQVGDWNAVWLQCESSPWEKGLGDRVRIKVYIGKLVQGQYCSFFTPSSKSHLSTFFFKTLHLSPSLRITGFSTVWRVGYTTTSVLTLVCLQFGLILHYYFFSATFSKPLLYLCLSFDCSDIFFLLFSHSVVSYSLRPHGLQLTRLPCPPLSPEVCSNSCTLSHDAI